MRDAADGEAQTLLRALASSTGDASWRELTAAAGDADFHPDLPLWQQRLVGAGAVLSMASGRVGRAVKIDPVDVVNQRARLRGLTPQGTVSAGGSCRLLPTQDGWVAMSLNRPPDWELLPALFRIEQTAWDWEAVASATGQTVAVELESWAAELGLAAAALPAEAPLVEAPWRITTSPRPRENVSLGRVVDLTALWAGPLCTSLLRRAGADVITVESKGRPDASRNGDPELHQLLHDGNEFVSLDFNDSSDRDELHHLVDEADIVVSAARLRALQQLELDPFTTVDRRPDFTWVGISAYGLRGRWNNRIGYGDDTAVAGGLVNRKPTPSFVGDAVADPITGIYAAIAALAVAASGGGLVDIALRDVAAHIARSSQ